VHTYLKVGQQKIEIKKTSETSQFKGFQILLTEDVEINREIVMSLLEPTLLSIDCAENGKEAVRMFSEAPDRYDMIVMDIQMPEMDGYEATRQIRKFEAERAAKQTPQLSGLPQGVPIIAMTANVFREDIDQCLEAGMNDHLGKPLDPDLLLEKLQKYLTKKSNSIAEK
jgi:CheY-like chemotaxis protein